MDHSDAWETCAYYSFLGNCAIVGSIFSVRLVRYLNKRAREVYPSIVNKLLPHAIIEQNETLIRLLISAGASVKNCKYNNKTALELLLIEEKRVKEECSNHRLPFWRLLQLESVSSTEEMELQRRLRIAQLLIQHGADVHALFYTNQTPVGWGILHSERNRALIKLFLDQGADVSKINEKGNNVVQEYLTMASETLNYLGERGGIDVGFLRLIQPSGGFTTQLHEACIFHKIIDIRCNKDLLGDGVVDSKDKFGYTPLYYAIVSRGTPEATMNKISTIETLLSLGASINDKFFLFTDCNGEVETSVLELAMKLGDSKVFLLLLQQAAQLVDREGGDEEKALSDVNFRFIQGLEFEFKMVYSKYIEDLKKARIQKLIAEGQPSDFDYLAWLTTAFEGFANIVNF